MATNDFLVFGGGAGANVIPQVTYSGLTARTAGFSSGVAQSAQLNKVWRQSSIMAAVLAQFISDQTGQDAVDDGTTATLLANLKAAVRLQHGQCRLSVVSGTQLKLSPYNGNGLIINGLPQQVPGVGVSVSNAGLAAGTLYYAYSYMNAGVMALELSSTGHSTGTAGVEQKTGDPTRTLVGMVRTNASSQFVDSATQRFCLNWFNRRSIAATNTFNVNRSTTSTTPVELSPTERAEFLNWGDESTYVTFLASASQNTTSGSFSSSVGLDGITPAPFNMVVNVTAVNTPQNVSAMGALTPTEGYHYLTAYGAATAGFTATWLGQYPTLTANIRG
ncbi:hypothetical protein QTN24_15460 [Cupriavidus sp. SZY C1]|uniref:hypothetical protein n=1 Tax=Cupriavidus sp. SZY C1 TaxID=3055037 RepID=UPI0028B869C1|nr:hypothetical protein [Cupriavidus sp. SZY C1]MDT6962897.1 hypothetical protein [Cupriavidus sp. SZY C1]